ncbi:hypothetical protein ACHAWF_004579, partial [Thalassiosira exigua]
MIRNDTGNTFGKALSLQSPLEPKQNNTRSAPDSGNATSLLSSFESKWSWDATDWDDWVGKCCNYINTHSGCKIARWYYLPDEVVSPTKGRSHRDCDSMPKHRKLVNPKNQLRENDTIYINFVSLEQFIDQVLGELSVDVVVISGQDHLVESIEQQKFQKLLGHKHIIHFFCQNLGRYGGGKQTWQDNKLSPFPYGLSGSEKLASADLGVNNLRDTLEESRHKSKLIYAGPLTKTNAVRKEMPQETERLPRSEFFARMTNAHYVLSPDGDRPDCHRHYEAILFGTVPITQLDSSLYRHLSGAPVVFDNTNWNLTLLADDLDPAPVVNRNVILQDYWMDWVDVIAGTKLKWSNDLNSGAYGFSDGPQLSWCPIRDEINDWVAVSDFMTGRICLRHSHANPPGGPKWGVSDEDSESITRHLACC